MESRPIVMIDDSLGGKGMKQEANAKERRLFMSPRVSDTLRQAVPHRASKNEKSKSFHDQEFTKIFQKVEQLGSSQLSWKQRKELETKKMVSLGAKPEKGPKMPIAIGRRIKRNREKREEEKMQEEMALGLFNLKRGKKSTEKKSVQNRSLKVSEGIFKGGVLYVKPIVVKEVEREIDKGNLPGLKRKGKRKIGEKKKHKGRKKHKR